MPALPSRILYLAISGLAALLFSAYLIYDIQAVMGGRRGAYSPDDYVSSAGGPWLLTRTLHKRVWLRAPTLLRTSTFQCRQALTTHLPNFAAIPQVAAAMSIYLDIVQ
jgi:FtsH-binding integral membrane protein